MRMDRYENIENNNETKQTRTNKNQELYTDVYLNNVYVDINSLKDVVKSDVEEKVEETKPVNSIKEVNYNYEDKNYDINSLIEEVIKNKKDDKLKRSLDIGVNNLEIDSLIESINENQNKEQKNDKENEILLSDLLPSDDNTKVIPPLAEPILDTKLIDKNILEKEDEEESRDLEDSSMQDIQSDTSFVEEKNSKLKVILIIIFILIVVLIVAFILIKKDII
ncbi:MAG: hypothetical protein IJ501_04500 [Bacilli bacterium]|nr:hypothetical protein [Bacilli bacterium]